MDKNRLGKVLKKIRQQAGLSQKQLADLVDVHQTLIGKIETGETDTTTSVLKKVCLALKVSPVELLFDDEGIPDFLKTPEPEIMPDHSSHNGLMLHETSLVTLANYLRDRIKKENKTLNEEDRSDIQKVLSSCMCDLDNSDGNERTA